MKHSRLKKTHKGMIILATNIGFMPPLSTYKESLFRNYGRLGVS